MLAVMVMAESSSGIVEESTLVAEDDDPLQSARTDSGAGANGGAGTNGGASTCLKMGSTRSHSSTQSQSTPSTPEREAGHGQASGGAPLAAKLSSKRVVARKLDRSHRHWPQRRDEPGAHAQ